MFGNLEFINELQRRSDSLCRNILRKEQTFYTRESFVLFLKCVRDRFFDDINDWADFLQLLLDKIALNSRERSTMEDIAMDEFHTQLFRHAVCPFSFMLNPPKPPSGRLAQWDALTPLVRVYLRVPHGNPVRQGLPYMLKATAVSPLLVALTFNGAPSWFQSLDVAFGRLVQVGTPAAPAIRFEEDPDGFDGITDMVVSFVVYAARFMEGDEKNRTVPKVEIELFVVSKPVDLDTRKPDDPRPRHQIASFFSADFEDDNLVTVVPEPLLPHSRDAKPPCAWLGPGLLGSSSPGKGASPDPVGKISVDVEVRWDEEGDQSLFVGLLVKVCVDNPAARAEFDRGSRENVAVTQVSPCVLRVTVGSQEQDVALPLPASSEQFEVNYPEKEEGAYFEASPRDGGSEARY